MRAARVATSVLGAVAAAGVMGATDLAGAKDPAMQKLMGDNFAGLQAILTALMTSNYAGAPERLRVIENHASELTQTVPQSAEGDRDRFVGYAYNLGGHAADLNSILTLLMEHDKARPAEQIATDQLREAAAAHYGGMVITCVACHNRFRPLTP